MERDKLPNYKLRPVDKNVIRRYTLPGVEKGFKSIVSKVFRVKFTTNTDLTSKSVRESDESELAIFTRPKHVNFKKLDDRVLYQSVAWVLDTLNVQTSDYYELTDQQVLDILPNDSSSSFPVYKTKGKKESRKQLREDLISFWRTDWNKKLLFIRRYPAVIYHRFVPKMKSIDDKVVKYKIRQVWGIPFLVIFLECKYFNWFKVLFTERFSPYFTSGLRKEEVSEKIKSVRKRALMEGKLILCGDVSSFDKSIAPSFYSLFESVLSKIDNSIFKSILPILLNYFTYTPFIGVKGKVEYTIGGAASGNYLTTIFNTFVMFVVVAYNFISVNGKLPEPGDILVQGDDFIMLIPNEECFGKIKNNFKKFNFRLKLYDGAIVKRDEPIEFLGFFWDKYGEPDQTDLWLISRIMFPENYVEMAGPERVISRYLSLIFQLKRFKDLFKMFYDNDRYLRRIIHSRDVFNLRVIDASGRLTLNVLPLNLFLTKGWRAF